MNQQTLFISCAVVLATLPLLAISADVANHPAPHCVLTSLADHQQQHLQQLKGKVVYVDFWASWCGPCTQSFPFMNELNQEFKTQGLQVLGVNLDENLNEAHNFLIKRPAKFEIVTDNEQQCAQAFGLKAMPSSYLIDRKGIIRYQHLGFRSGEAEQVKTLIKQLLAETPDN